jgi:hypothetical protein
MKTVPSEYTKCIYTYTNNSLGPIKLLTEYVCVCVRGVKGKQKSGAGTQRIEENSLFTIKHFPST